jgi:hypothetical protein
MVTGPMHRRRRILPLVAALVIAATVAVPALSQGGSHASGTLSHTAGQDMRLTVKNDGTTQIERLHYDLPAGFSPTGCRVIQPAGASCFPDDRGFSIRGGFRLNPGDELIAEFGFSSHASCRTTAARRNAAPVEAAQATCPFPSDPQDDLLFWAQTVSGSPEGPSHVGGPGEKEKAKSADVAAGIKIVRPAKLPANPAGVTGNVAQGDLELRATNGGPDQADAVTISGTVTLPGRSTLLPGPGNTTTKALGNLARGKSATHTTGLILTDAGEIAVTATAKSATPDPDDPLDESDNNTATLTTLVLDVPDTNGAKATLVGRERKPKFSGKGGKGTKKVQGAVQRVGGGGSKASAARCTWVGSKRARMKRRACNQPVWLDASGTRNWTLTLGRPLPRGRYIFFARAIGANGLSELGWSRADGNRLDFLLR